MSAWRCFEYRLVLWCSSFPGYVNCCSLLSGSLSIAYCLTLQRPTANCSCPGRPPTASPWSRVTSVGLSWVLVDTSFSLRAFNHRGSSRVAGDAACGSGPRHPHHLPVEIREDGGAPSPPHCRSIPAERGDPALPAHSSSCRKIVKMDVSTPQTIARNFFVVCKGQCDNYYSFKQKTKKRNDT